MGYLYRPKLRSGDPKRIWWVKYYVNGRPLRGRTGTDNETEARTFLKGREGRVARWRPILGREPHSVRGDARGPSCLLPDPGRGRRGSGTSGWRTSTIPSSDSHPLAAYRKR